MTEHSQMTDLLSTKTSVLRDELLVWLNQSLAIANFKDYCPNGLQVEGKERIAKVVTGVTASEALLKAAVIAQADAVLVHHGWFWRNEDPCVTKIKKKRLALCLQHDMSLLAYHLPLDAHPVWGNNVQLAQRLNLQIGRDERGHFESCGDGGLVLLGTSSECHTLDELVKQLRAKIHANPLVVGDLGRSIKRIAWCTGAAQSYFQAAIDAGADVFITGEFSESTYHLAQESGVAFIGAGHHATERFGVQALGEAMRAHFGIEVEFIDIPNPI